MPAPTDPSTTPGAASKNLLGSETSPYLLQHADNPVHWYPWGDAAIAAAKERDVPILLSVGYAACHWCHVMAHESFEDDATAAVMNELFVNVKVDREERPDIDAIYMMALHSLGEQGGWPLTMFLTPEGGPFWGGTYFPKASGMGRPSFQHVLREVSRIYQDEREKVDFNAQAMRDHLTATTEAPETPEVTRALLVGLVDRLVSDAIDPDWGGLKGAPKFPQPSALSLLWRTGVVFNRSKARDAVHRSLRAICEGGIYDHLGGGFARYTVDERWLIPHFEKMLYDNALLVDLLTDAWRDGQDKVFAQRVGETCEWLLREMLTDGGMPTAHVAGADPLPGLQAFASSYDADSEGQEGKFYVWDASEIKALLGADDYAEFADAYDVSEAGNWEGTNILNRLYVMRDDPRGTADAALQERLQHMRATLWRAREDRVKPGWDDKVLADWNGLAISALARAGRVFGQPAWCEAAAGAFRFVQVHMQTPTAVDEPGASDGRRLLHACRSGKARIAATANDYANMVAAALRLHAEGIALPPVDEAAPDALTQAQLWQDTFDAHYWVDGRGYALTADDVTDVFVRLHAARDDATPNAHATTLSNLVHLHMLTGELRYLEQARNLVETLRPDLARNLVAHMGVLAAAIDLLQPQEIAVLGARTADGEPEPAAQALLSGLHEAAAAGALEQLTDLTPAFASGALLGKDAIDGNPTAYVCVGTSCSLPVTGAAELTSLVRGGRLT
ncbi:MAG: thioredoxin domain-containing protein [Pseudomonadota bacterium]